MKTLTTPLLALAILFLLVGCGGSSVDLPESVITEDTYALQWTDFSAIDPDAGVKAFNRLADDIDDDQSKARLWMSMQADLIQTDYTERWEAFTEAGCTGMLKVFYAVPTTTGEGDFQTTRISYQKHMFIKADKDADDDELVKALAEFAEADGNASLKLVAVGEDTGWFWLTREAATASSPKMPEGANEKALAAMKGLMDDGGDAPMVTVWRPVGPITDKLDEELERDDLDDDRKTELELAKSMQSVVMTCSSGRGATTDTTITFAESEDAKAFAERENADSPQLKAALKQLMIGSENPPHPSVIDDLVEDNEFRVSGKTASVELDAGAVESMMLLMGARLGAGGDMTAPPHADISSALRLPSGADVPGVMSCYNRLVFGRYNLPQ